jgi:hypothetical protein
LGPVAELDLGLDRQQPLAQGAHREPFKSEPRLSEHIIIWDIETVPDLEAIDRVHELPQLSTRLLKRRSERNFRSYRFAKSSALVL